MLITTANDLPGYEITETFGEVFGLTVRSRNIGSQLGAGLKSILGGELKGMTKMLAEGREHATERLVEEARRETPVIVVDFHAEATSEKVALAYHLDGRVTAVLGTHTHVQTADARVLRGGTAAITDAGMTGPHDSVIGSVPEGAVRRFTTGFPVRLEPATDDVRIEGALVECGDDGRATSCEIGRAHV